MCSVFVTTGPSSLCTGGLSIFQNSVQYAARVVPVRILEKKTHSWLLVTKRARLSREKELFARCKDLIGTGT